MTTGYSAAIDSSDTVFSYCTETVWGTLPATVFKQLRLTGESLSENKTRTRPQEINPSGVVSHAITTQVAVEGAFNFAMSADTFDDFIAAALNGAPGAVVTNGVVVNTFQIQKKLAAALFLRYAGCYVSQWQLNAAVGGFVEGSFNLMAKNEAKAIAEAGTGAPTAAPTGRVFDTIQGVANLEVDASPIVSPLQSLQLNVVKQNARTQYGIGSADAVGIGRGSIDLNGTMSAYFADFSLYDLYKAETDIVLTFDLIDNTGDGYSFELPAATIMNPSIVAGGPDTDIIAEFALEGNPDATNVIMTVTRIEV